MSISPIGSDAVGSNAPIATQMPAPPPPQAKAAEQETKKDTVTVSKQAQMLANDGDTAAAEIKESAAEKASEALKGKK